MTYRRLLSLALSLVCLTIARPSQAEEKLPVFEADVLPVLASKCGRCHGKKLRKGDLDLSSIEGLRRGGESGEPSIAKSVDESLLWIMIDGGDMPPEGEPPMTAKETALIHRWISAGSPALSVPREEDKQLTQHDVLPIVLLRCTTCHGPRLKMGGLDLRTRNTMLKGGDSGPALVPGDPDASRMIQRINSEACPPRQLLLKYFVRRPPTSEVRILREWIAAGAPEVDILPDVATTESDPLVSDEDRQHWAFQPPQRPAKGNSIDDFIRAKLAEVDLQLSPEADRDTLIRRAYLNLIGMPPGLNDWKHWRNSTDSDWYEKLIDHLLASPHYGERWGRYWLDVAGYADSEGGVSADPIRKVAWKYRDYVIRSFNDDKPYDRFLIEQIAGDELIDHENAPEITQEMVDNLIATGFLRMGIDQTGSRTMNFVPERLGVINDAITILGSGIMGLTMECAKCHSHKYDAIPQRDYYRLKAIFQGAFDEHDWLSFKNRSLNIDTPDRQHRVNEVNPPLAKAVKQLEAQLKTATANLQLELLRQHYPDQPESDRTATLQALRVADNNRTQPQRILVEMLQKVEVLPDTSQPPAVIQARQTRSDIEHELLETRRKMEPPLTIRAVWDRGVPSPTYILRRGEHDKPGRLVGPGVPSVLTDGRTPFVARPPFPHGSQKTGRRLAFARWLTSSDHPLTGRVQVNRVWYHHFGTGLVKSLENFGVKGERPSHPELLDWLAVTFVERGWSIKELHRLVMTSQTYRQSSRITEDRLKADPQNRLLSRMPVRRMNAEALRDSLLSVAGVLDRSSGGPPDPISVDRNGLVSIRPSRDGRWRRSIYLQYRRTEIPSMMATFDYPVMGPNCLTRSVSTVSPQSLMLMNNEHVRELAVSLADRVESLLGDQRSNDNRKRIDAIYKLALSRPPSDEERQLGIRMLSSLSRTEDASTSEALAAYCHAILNSAAFIYVD